MTLESTYAMYISRMDALPNILVVDDHPMVRFGLVQVLLKTGIWGSCFEVDGVLEAKEILAREPIAFVIVDISLKPNQADGLDLVRYLHMHHRQCKILVLSMHDEVLYGRRALQAGAHGYVMKRCPMRQILAAINEIIAGKIHLSKSSANGTQDLGENSTPANDPLTILSDRELEVVLQLGQGLPPRIIAENLFISVKTVEAHRSNIRKKLNLPDAVALNSFAIAFAKQRQHD